MQPYPFIIEAAVGTAGGLPVTQQIYERASGRNAAIGTVEEDIWDFGGATKWMTSAETVRIRGGGNAADDVAGLGAQQVTVEGLDTDFNPVSETIDTAGINPSAATTQTFIRVLRAFVARSGTYTAANTGNIVLENASLDEVSQITATFGESQNSQFTVRAGYTAFITNWFANTLAPSATVLLQFYKRERANATATNIAARQLLASINLGDTGAARQNISYPIVLPELTDIWWTGIASAGSHTANVYYDLLLAQNSALS